MNYPFENDTSAVIKKLARKSVRFDKKKNLFCLSAIIVAVAMIMMSLLTVQNIIYQNQKEIEGLHQYQCRCDRQHQDQQRSGEAAACGRELLK